MRIIIESDDAASAAARTDGPGGARPQEAPIDAGPSRAAEEGTGPVSESGVETVSAGPPPAELVEAITAAGGSTEPPEGGAGGTDAGPAPPE